MHPFFIDDFIMPTERGNENNKRRRRFPNPKYTSVILIQKFHKELQPFVENQPKR
jgi:hypothetical protein